MEAAPRDIPGEQGREDAVEWGGAELGGDKVVFCGGGCCWLSRRLLCPLGTHVLGVALHDQTVIQAKALVHADGCLLQKWGRRFGEQSAAVA